MHRVFSCSILELGSLLHGWRTMPAGSLQCFQHNLLSQDGERLELRLGEPSPPNSYSVCTYGSGSQSQATPDSLSCLPGFELLIVLLSGSREGDEQPFCQQGRSCLCEPQFTQFHFADLADTSDAIDVLFTCLAPSESEASVATVRCWRGCGRKKTWMCVFFLKGVAPAMPGPGETIWHLL